MIHIRSVQDPIKSNPKLLYHAVMAVQRADAMGLMPSGYVVHELGVDALREIVERATHLGVGTNAATALKRPHLEFETKPLEEILERFNVALEASPVPKLEWRRLVPILRIDTLARLLGISTVSARRYRISARRTPDEVADRLHCIALIVGALEGAYNDIGVRRWFDRPRAQLKDRAPAAILSGNWQPDSPEVRKVRALAESLTASPAT
jgi:uncharacterized protein (DUF2384 family)